MQIQGLSVEQYFQFTGLNAKTFVDQMKPQAEKRIKNSLVLEAVVKAENITVSDEEMEEEFKKMAAQYNMEIEKVKELIGDAEKKQIEMDIANAKAITLIADSAVEE